MAPREAKGLLSRVFGSRAKDPLWDGFINRPLSDPKNDLAGAIRAAPEGAVYPVKTEVSDPAAMSLDIKELGRWFGVDVVGIARLEASHVHPDQLRDGAEPRPAEDVARDYPYAIVCGVVTDYDPESTCV